MGHVMDLGLALVLGVLFGGLTVLLFVLHWGGKTFMNFISALWRR